MLGILDPLSCFNSTELPQDTQISNQSLHFVSVGSTRRLKIFDGFSLLITEPVWHWSRHHTHVLALKSLAYDNSFVFLRMIHELSIRAGTSYGTLDKQNNI